MKTPRVPLAALALVLASFARASDPTFLFIPQSDAGIIDFTKPQNGADWKLIHIGRADKDLSTIRLAPRGAPKGEPITLVNPYDEYFIIRAKDAARTSGTYPVLSVSPDPYPGAMRGEPVRAIGPGGLPTGPQFWMPSRDNGDIRDQQQWLKIPADNTRVARSPIQGSPAWLTAPGTTPRETLNSWLLTPGQSSSLPWLRAAAPPTYYTAVTNYKYDAKTKKLVSADGQAKAVTVASVPGEFFLTPPAVPHDFKIGGLKLVNTRGETVDPKAGAQKPKPDAVKKNFVKAPTAHNWADKVTAIGTWHAVETAQPPIPMAAVTPMTFYCYHETLDGHGTISGHLKKGYDIVECVDWVIPKGDATSEEGAKKYKTRNYTTVIDVVYKEGALRSVGTGANLILKDKPLSKAAIGGLGYVKVTQAKAAEAPAVAGLSAKEQLWLDRSEKDLYAAGLPKDGKDAPAAHVKKYREAVVANLDPNADAIGKYKAATGKDKPVAKEVDDALPAKVWGGDNNAIVGLAGPLLDIQLSKEELAAFEKLPAADPKGHTPAFVYAQSRGNNDGKGKNDTDFVAANYDPIALHRSVMIARAALSKAGKAPVTGPNGETKPGDVKPGDAKPGDANEIVKLLTKEELALLTPKELADYLHIAESAKGKIDDKSLQDLTKKLRAQIIADERATHPYVTLTDKTFEKAPKWQKETFCSLADVGGAGAVIGTGPSKAPAMDPRKGAALPDLERIAAEGVALQQAAAAQAPKAMPPWAVGPCAGLYPSSQRSPPPPADNGVGNLTGGKKTTGPDSEIKAKEKSKWITQDLMVTAAKGGLTGLLIGSLFGPIGLIAGPLIGAAVFYGVTKLQE